MASTSAPRIYRSAVSPARSARHFSTTSATSLRRLRGKLTAKQINDRIEEVYKPFDEEDVSDIAAKDTTAMGHVALDQQRQMLQVMRLIENEIPQRR